MTAAPAIDAARPDLAVIAGGGQVINRHAPAEALTEMFGLAAVGLSVTGARIVGRGSTASVDVRLSDGSEILFERLGDVANPKRLMTEIAACTTAVVAIKAPQALQAVALLRSLAEQEATLTNDHLSAEWGVTFLQSAPTMDVDMNDQGARWQAFCTLERTDPITKARLDGTSIPSGCLALVHEDGTRYVRCGWFRAFAKTEDPTASPQEIAHRMQRVGWQRRGQSGRIKATRPGNQGTLVWTFYAVPADWETDR